MSRLFVNFIYHVLLVSVVLGGLFSRTIITTPASLVREVCLWSLILLAIWSGRREAIRVTGFARVGLGVLFASFVMAGVVTFSYSFDVQTISNKWAVLYKFFQLFFFIFIFSSYRGLTGRSLARLTRWFVVYCCAYAIVSPVIYFSTPAIMIENFRWWGRFGVGYPTMDAQLFIFAVCAIIFGSFFNGFSKVAVLAICLLGVAIQVTGTSAVTMVFVLGLYCAMNIRAAVKMAPVFVLIVVAGGIGVSLLSPNLTSDAADLVLIKAHNLIGSSTSVNTMDIRQDQYDSLLYMIRGDSMANIFGIGTGIYVENQYGFSRVALGWVGLACLLVFLTLVSFEGWRRRRVDHLLLLASCGVLVLSSYTLTYFYLFPLNAAFALIMCYSEELKREAGAGHGLARGTL